MNDRCLQDVWERGGWHSHRCGRVEAFTAHSEPGRSPRRATMSGDSMRERERAHLEAELGRLKGKRGQLSDELGRVEKHLAEVQIQLSPIKVGDIITDDRSVEYVVRSIEPKSWGGYWYRGSKRKKDGNWSAAVQLLISPRLVA